MASNKVPIVAQVEKIAQPVAQQLNLQLWDIEYVKEGASWFLRFYIDKEGGVSLDDCEAFSRAVDGPLDEADPIDQQYYLEVSSPGIERELKKDWHFQSQLGKPVRIRLIRPATNGSRELTGNLVSFDGSEIILENDGEKSVVKQSDTAFVRLSDPEDFV
jgi:Uncharacterized protein conserved in bacteria